MKLAAQEHLIPGATILGKWRAIEPLGYRGIELRGSGDAEFAARLPDLREAVRQGVVFSSICSILPTFVGGFDATQRRDAIERVKVLLSAAAELGASGVVTPAAYGIHSNALPPFKAPREPAEDRKVLLDGFAELGLHAKSEGVVVYIEPLNRYEDHMVNRLEQAVSLCEEVNLPSVAIMADLFHMSVEEHNSSAALVAASRWLGHIHGADSNRLEPGAGQTDFEAIMGALNGIGYGGYIALECGLSGAPLVSLGNAAKVLA